MSDIPLRTIRRNKARAGYAPLLDNAESETASPPQQTRSMRTSVTAAAFPGGSRKKDAGKNKDRYTDDPEEEAGLLDENGEEEYDEEEHRLRREIEASSSQVCIH